jgi:aldose 1-epimerase
MKKRTLGFVMLILCSAIVFNSCKTKSTEKKLKAEESIKSEFFGILPSGDSAYLYTLSSDSGITVKITNYGGIITEILTPDKEGNKANIVLGFDKLDNYLGEHPYFGALIGRYGNRIAKGAFTIDGQSYKLAKNNGNNALHGGLFGFDKVLWTSKPFEKESVQGLELTYVSRDMEEGYPGNMSVKVIYELSGNDLTIYYEANTDKATPVNLTNHSYFNLSQDGTILDHFITINAKGYTPVDAELIPTGEIAPVEGTPFDFTTPHTIGERIMETDGGYDHNFVLDRSGKDLENIATVEDPNSGRTIEVLTTEPGVQFYTGNFLDGSIVSRGITYERNFGLCLETQHFPDSPNQANFPNTILRPGEEYNTKTVYRFGVIASDD